jgi:hypothetical protein
MTGFPTFTIKCTYTTVLRVSSVITWLNPCQNYFFGNFALMFCSILGAGRGPVEIGRIRSGGLNSRSVL